MNILFLTKGALPFPPVNGGAVETLLYSLVKENEEKQVFDFTVISTALPEESVPEEFSHTTVVYASKENSLMKDAAVFSKYAAAKIIGKFMKRSIFTDCFPHILEKALEVLETENYDLVIDLNCVERVRKLKEAANGKTAIYLHNDYINKELWQAEHLLKTVDGIFTVSDFLSRKILEVKKDSQVHKVSNGIEKRTTVNLTKEQKTAARKRWAVEADELVLLFCGRLHETKGPHRILEAVDKLQTERKIHVFLVGGISHGSANKNNYTTYLKELAEKSQVTVHFTGHLSQEKVGELLSIADLSLSPSSFNETCCLSMVEAQQAGVPAIVTAIGGIPEYFIEGGGYLLDEENITDELTRTLQYCLDSDVQTNMKNQLTKYDNIHSIQRMYKEFEQAVQAVV
ncbi:glycosyltransferase family 4 protein [Enterococcus rotai]|uniref:glycosyltransferase family 4 protein n=1 Tax=Enterococcus rotai TaxID=118060 RepID=UPI0032B5540C